MNSNRRKIKLFSSFLLSCISIIGFSQNTQTQKFHDTKGNIEVTSAGQLQYTLAIETPPGIKNMVPDVNLTYVSGAGNGLAGYGWNISGIASISRTGKNLEKDGVMKGVQLDYSDYYSFGGQRLILKLGEYGKDGAEYITEKYSNIKIKSVGAIAGQSWQGPEYWEVTLENGSQVWYGATSSGNSNARTPLDYYIVKSKDTNGNYITYDYILENNVAVINNIEWGGNETQNTPSINKMMFTFQARPKSETAYIKGSEFSQSKLLESITVTTKGKQHKKYKLIYKTDYQKTLYRYLEKITILNSDDEETTPAHFIYEKSYNPYTANRHDWKAGTTLKPNSDTDVIGDFDGDGNLDLLRYHSVTSDKIPQKGLYLYKNFYSLTLDVSNNIPQFIESTLLGLKEAVAVNLKKENLIHNRQGFVIYQKVKNSTTSKFDLELLFYSIGGNNQLVLNHRKVIANSDYDNTYGTSQNGTVTTIEGMKNVDFNGDGLSEIILMFNDKVCQSLGGPTGRPSKCDERKRYYVVDLNESLQNNSWFYPLSLYPDSDKRDQDVFTLYRTGDFNGDGLFDFLKINADKNPLLITFQKNTSGKYTSSLSPFNPSNSEIIKGVWEDGLVGDFNGDGLSDLMVTADVTSALWYLYTSKGNGFKEEIVAFERQAKTRQILTESNENIKVYNPRTFVAYDINNDGKTDLVNLQSQRFYNRYWAEDSTFGAAYKEEIRLTFKVFSIFGGDYSTVNDIYGYSDYNTYFTANNYAQQLAVGKSDFIGVPADLWTGAMLKKIVMGSIGEIDLAYGKGQYTKSSNFFDISMEGRIKSIIQGGVTTDITYKQLDKTKNPGLYDGVKTENYPYVEINQSTGMYVVSELSQSITSDKKLKKDFRYRGLTSNILGRGMIGFRKTARSSWYAEGFENTKVWSGVEIDPANEGVPVKEWKIKTNEESKIFTEDLSENNLQLLSLSTITYQKDKLLNGQTVANISDADKAKIVTSLLPKTSRSKDFLTNVITENTITYGQYYLPSISKTSVNGNIGVSSQQFTYANNPSGQGKDYYIGRVTVKVNENNAYSDNHKTMELYIYENNLVKMIGIIPGADIHNLNNGITNEFMYDGFGNIIKKTIKIGNNNAINVNDGPTQTEGSEFDSTGRFVIKKTDNLGLETNFTYNDLGQILTQTDPLGNIITNTYDNWGKLLTSANNLEGTTTYVYDKDTNYNVTITQNESDGNITKVFTNKLGQEYRTSTKAFEQGKFVSKDIQYDILGRKTKESEPYFEGQSANQWNTIIYDDSVFPAKVTTTAFNGKQTETMVSGLATTVKELNINGYQRTTSKTADALGNIIATTDKGGTIHFSYNAIGKQIQAKYGENIVTTKYDKWGRKSEFNDPSNGLYKYQYNGFGQPTKIISPKGTKEYIYNKSGQLISQKELSIADAGQATNKTISFVYNSKGLLIKKSGIAQGQEFSSDFTYDPQGRLISTSENSYGRKYTQKGIIYDDKGRIVSFEKELQGGITTKVAIENVYSAWNGELYQIKDKNSGKVLWELKETNVKGQALKTKLGEVEIKNSYDVNGFLTNTNHSSAIKPSILQLSYSFDAIKNELRTRTTSGDFNITESFDYDDNNRLTNWTSPITGIKPSSDRNVYDSKGRITQNDQIGNIKFENSDRIYQPTGMTLNTTGMQNYNGDLIQTITYNENNDPVQINGEKARINFGYGLESMRQKVNIIELKKSPMPSGKPQFTWQDTFTKFYSEDGSFEIVIDLINQKEKHILYIEGSPYESNIVYLKDFGQTEGSYKFLHKDYLGSILAISDESGNRLEQRHFDAWGNLTHLQYGNTPVITDKNVIDNTLLLVDRGYTGHEHFAEVGIIHMNGRLYDPLLRRFLNADENIQDPTNTQNYNKYGYVMNNPLMYNDPDGEFWMWLAGALVGGYLNGVAANNGNWNPTKWNWQKSWSAVVGGAIGGAAIGGTIGNISNNAGAIKNYLPGIVSGGLNSAFSGGNFLGGAIGGLFYSADVFDNKLATNMNDKQYTKLNQLFNSESPTILGKNILAGFLEKNGIMPYDPATAKSLNKIISLFSLPGQWIKVGDRSTIADFSTGYLNYSINSTTQYLELFINGTLQSTSWGVTNPINGKIILAPRLIDGLENNFFAASVVIHEQDHFSNFKVGIYQGNNFISNELNELSAYRAAAKWTGSMEKQGFIHLKNVIEYFLKLYNH